MVQGSRVGAGFQIAIARKGNKKPYVRVDLRMRIEESKVINGR